MKRKIVSGVLTLAMASLAVAPSLAGALEDGFAALGQKDFAKARSLLLPLANSGNAVAQFNIGAMYAEGWGVSQDNREAAAWYQKAAQQDNEDAEVSLALMYAEGRGVEKDYKEAIEWYLRAAQHGNALAQNNIGSLYFNGNGVAKDDARAVEWFEKSAAQGLKEGENSLGEMYYKGWGVPKDHDKGVAWFMKAAKQGLSIAQTNVFNVYLSIAEKGDAKAMHNVATMCLQGWSGHQKTEECLAWYERAAALGLDASRQNLADVYGNGLFGVPLDPQKEKYWKAQIGKP